MPKKANKFYWDELLACPLKEAMDHAMALGLTMEDAKVLLLLRLTNAVERLTTTFEKYSEAGL